MQDTCGVATREHAANRGSLRFAGADRVPIGVLTISQPRLFTKGVDAAFLGAVNKPAKARRFPSASTTSACPSTLSMEVW